MTSCAFTRGESNSGRESDFGTTGVASSGESGAAWTMRASRGVEISSTLW